MANMAPTTLLETNMSFSLFFALIEAVASVVFAVSEAATSQRCGRPASPLLFGG